jgi:MFS family permease
MFAVGALGGALVAARRGRPSLRLLIAMSFAFAVLEIITGFMPDYWTFLIALVPTGLALLTFTTAANSSVQLGTTAEMRGRVMGLYMLVFLGGTPLGSPLAGWVAQAYGARMSVEAGGVISLAATVIMAWLFVRHRGIEFRSLLRRPKLARSAA